MKSETRIVMKDIPNLASEQTRNDRARAWRFVFDCRLLLPQPA
jgi:hypothetical protein